MNKEFSKIDFNDYFNKSTLKDNPEVPTSCKLPIVLKMDIESTRFIEFCSKEYDLLGIKGYRRCSDKIG